MTIIGYWPNFGGPSDNLSTAEWAFRELWGRIAHGKLAAGERVTEGSLAALLDVSRTPLREAIVRLQEIGFIHRQRNRTLVIAPMSAEEAEELTLIRERLEGLVARLAARNSARHPEKLEQVLQRVEHMKTLGALDSEPTWVLRHGDEFHSALLAISESRRLPSTLFQIYLAIERYRYLVNENRDRSREIAEEHEQIIRAVVAGDEDAAEAAMHAHISHSRQLYIDELRRRLPAEEATHAL